MGFEPPRSFAASGRMLGPCAFERVQNARVRAASAQVFLELGGELFARGLAVAPHQRSRSHDDSRQAVAALPRLAVEDRALQRMHRFGGAESFDSRDRLAFE